MLKLIRNTKYWLLRSNKYAFSAFFENIVKKSEQQSQNEAPKKAYQVLFSTSLEMTPKLPSPHILKMIKARGITKIMASNHSLNHQSVLLAHIECLYALISRVEPSISGVQIFTDYIYRVMKDLFSKNAETQKNAEKCSLMNVVKPSILTKFVKIVQAIDPFYNEYMRMLMSSFIIKAIEFSRSNLQAKTKKIAKLTKLQQSVLEGKDFPITEEGTPLTPSNIKNYVQNQIKNLNLDYPHLQTSDLLCGMQYILSVGYYSQNFLDFAISMLLTDDINSSNNLMMIVYKLRIIISLEQFKNYKKLSDNSNLIFGSIYNLTIEKYFQLLQNNLTFFQALHSEDQAIQTSLITQFLNKQHFLKAKQVYLSMFKNVLNTMVNGNLLIDLKKMRGILEIVLIMFTHEDTSDIHELLRQYQKAIVLYPSCMLNKLQIQSLVSEKYGFKSDIFAKEFFNQLITQKSKIDNNKQYIHPIHQTSREIHLAEKFLTFLNISVNPSKENYATAHQMASSLFSQNVWLALAEGNTLNENFFKNPSINSVLFFMKAKLINITSLPLKRKSIQYIATKLQVKSITKYQQNLNSQLLVGLNKFTLKYDNYSQWRNNQHARLATIFRLAINYYDQTSKKKSQEAYLFMNDFMAKIVGNSSIYAVIRQNFAYPQILELLTELQKRYQENKYPIFTRDLEAVKKFYSQQLIKASQEPQTYRLYYQQKLDCIEHNRVLIPYYQDIYGISGLSALANQGLFHQAMRRYYKQKQALKKQIETYCKFYKQENTSVVLNHLEFPYLADLKITAKKENIVLLFNTQDSEKTYFLNSVHLEKQKQSEIYWKSKNYQVIYIKNEKDIENFMENKIKKKNKTHNKP